MAPGLFLLPRQSQQGCRPTRFLVFCSPSRLFQHDTKLCVHLSGLGTIKTNYLDPKLFSHLHGLAKNAAPRHGRQLIKPPGRQLAQLAKPESVYIREFIMTQYFRPSTGIQSSTNFILTWPACPSAYLHMIIHGFVFEIYKTGS